MRRPWRIVEIYLALFVRLQVALRLDSSTQPLQSGPGLMLMYVHLQRDLYFHSVCSFENGRLTNAQGAFIRGISSPQLLRVAPRSLPIYYHCKAARLYPPPLQNLYKNISERLSEGSAMPWQQPQHYRLLPASETISCFTHLCGEITKETSLTEQIRILAQTDCPAAHCWTPNRKTVMWNWSLAFIKALWQAAVLDALG